MRAMIKTENFIKNNGVLFEDFTFNSPYFERYGRLFGKLNSGILNTLEF